jgi:hypothetical protein
MKEASTIQVAYLIRIIIQKIFTLILWYDPNIQNISGQSHIYTISALNALASLQVHYNF